MQIERKFPDLHAYIETMFICENCGYELNGTQGAAVKDERLKLYIQPCRVCLQEVKEQAYYYASSRGNPT